jgi:hypothetical protein
MTITAVEYRVTTTDGTIEYSGYVDDDGTLWVHPLTGPEGDELPPPDHLPECTRCTVCSPDGSSWDWEVLGREWALISHTVPAELEV